jgi:hypothetical protein
MMGRAREDRVNGAYDPIMVKYGKISFGEQPKAFDKMLLASPDCAS